MTLRVEETDSFEGVLARRDSWRALVAAAPEADVFQTWEWVTAWLGGFWRDRPIAFLFVHDGDRLVGIVPLVHDVEGVLGCADAYSLPFNAHVRRMDVVCAGAPASAVLGAALDHLRATRGSVRVALREGLVESSAGRALPDVAGERRLTGRVLDRDASPIVRLDGDWEGYLATRSSHTRQELRRKAKRAEREGLTWSSVDRLEDVLRTMADVFEIERRSWKEDEGTSFTAEAGLDGFYLDVAVRLADAGWLRIYVLRHGERPVAHVFGAEYRGEYFAFKTSYDAEYRPLSPGQVLFHHALKDSFDRRLRAFDFLGHPSRWKLELANDERRHRRVCASPKLDAQCHWCAFRDGQALPLARKVAPAVREWREMTLAAMRGAGLPGEAIAAMAPTPFKK